MSDTPTTNENFSAIEDRVKNYLRKEFPFLTEEEIQESWEKYYQTQVQINIHQAPEPGETESQDKA